MILLRCACFRRLLTTRSFCTTMALTEVSSMRIDYKESRIEDDQLPSLDPFKWFDIWFKEATQHSDIKEANAMNIATATKNGDVSARMVLLKKVTERGFGFFTNYESQKGTQLAENPRGAITFYWDPLQKQIRICGNVERMSDEASSEYFHSRPKGSQIGAMVSHQTSVIPDSKCLEQREKDLSQKYEGKVIPKPDYWGGFLLVPETIEFWCGRSNRLHDRIRFRRPKKDEVINTALTKEGDNGWLYERLSP